MDNDLFERLPSEIVPDILLRLPAQTIMSCKCVSKPWLNLLTTPEFVKSHISKSVRGMIIHLEGNYRKPYHIIQFVDEVDGNHLGHRWNIVFNFDLPFDKAKLHSSANGLLFLLNNSGDTFLFNPTTCNYVKLPSPRESPYSKTYGFGVSGLTGQYKVVRLVTQRSYPLGPKSREYRDNRFECEVYTVGTVSWRKIAFDCPFKYEVDLTASSQNLNGNPHWLVGKSEILCFDIETEVFSTFSAPPVNGHDKYRNLSVLGDCLCVCDYKEDREFMNRYKIEIWLMKEYGDDESWTKELVIRNSGLDEPSGFRCLVKLFKDGDILMVPGCNKMLCYSNKTETIRLVGLSGLENLGSFDPIFCSPSFLSVESFGMETVKSIYSDERSDDYGNDEFDSDDYESDDE